MTLEEFALMAGVVIVECDAATWGGPYGYTTKDSPSCTVCGAESIEAAYRMWLSRLVGEQASKALLALLSEPDESDVEQATADIIEYGRWGDEWDREYIRERIAKAVIAALDAARCAGGTDLAIETP
jgi:hypothetical protein